MHDLLQVDCRIYNVVYIVGRNLVYIDKSYGGSKSRIFFELIPAQILHTKGTSVIRNFHLATTYILGETLSLGKIRRKILS